MASRTVKLRHGRANSTKNYDQQQQRPHADPQQRIQNGGWTEPHLSRLLDQRLFSLYVSFPSLISGVSIVLRLFFLGSPFVYTLIEPFLSLSCFIITRWSHVKMRIKFWFSISRFSFANVVWQVSGAWEQYAEGLPNSIWVKYNGLLDRGKQWSFSPWKTK